MTNATDVLKRMLDERGVKWWDSRYGEQVVFQVGEVKWFADDGCRDGMLELSTIAITPDQAIAATLGWIDEPDTIRNELTDGGLIADVLAPVCVDEKERRAFERERVHERFAQQIFKEATS